MSHFISANSCKVKEGGERGEKRRMKEPLMNEDGRRLLRAEDEPGAPLTFSPLLDFIIGAGMAFSRSLQRPRDQQPLISTGTLIEGGVFYLIFFLESH